MTADAAVVAYHDGTKHSFNGFARSLGYLDWASQPNPFRSFDGAPLFPLKDLTQPVAGLLRYSLGLSAWKSFRGSRWALRCNPSSGNLHPTEAYVIGRDLPGGPGVYHYAPDRHALERRCVVDDPERVAPRGSAGAPERAALQVVLTSIHWREAWKYGERAFRYCQHDVGHAIAAVRFAAALEGYTATLLPRFSHAQIAALAGIDRDDDYIEAEREDPACVLRVEPAAGGVLSDPATSAMLALGRWTGRANQLSEDHVQWTLIDDVAAATVDPGLDRPCAGVDTTRHPPYSADVILRRRSAVAFDGRSSTSRDTFLGMMKRLVHDGSAPWDTLWWTPRIHLALFVHRVDDVEPGLYLLVRDATAIDRLEQSLQRDFLWRSDPELPSLFLLARGDCRRLSERLSCDQAIAADGFFSAGMIADFDRSLDEFGPSFYRHLFWESGVVGQVLYLEAEAAGARGTGIGCFYDDPVHEVLGITDHSFQSLYHFTVGIPVEDTRLTTEPGYPWETRQT